MDLRESLQHKINNKTKPYGALGILEEVALQIGLIQSTVSPVISNPQILVFAGDHGIAATGLVNPYPQAVTAQMVLNFVNGGAAINVFCRQHHIALTVVDAGVNVDFDKSLPIIHAKIKKGTANYALQNAMTYEDAITAIEKGKAIVEKLSLKTNQQVGLGEACNCIGFGEMGIGNTSAASLIMSAVTGIAIEECVGRGTGSSDEQLLQKIEILKQVYQKHQLQTLANQPINLLSTVGGFEIAMMVGAYLKAAELRMVIVVDGFISTAALLIAKILCNSDASLPPFGSWGLLFAHNSGEQGHEKMLQYLVAKPLLHLGMRLGEGTGAALAIPLIQSAVNFLNEMASFDSAGVANKQQPLR